MITSDQKVVGSIPTGRTISSTTWVEGVFRKIRLPAAQDETKMKATHPVSAGEATTREGRTRKGLFVRVLVSRSGVNSNRWC